MEPLSVRDNDTFTQRLQSCPRIVAATFLLTGLVLGGILVSVGFAIGSGNAPSPAPAPAPANITASFDEYSNHWPVQSPPTNVNFGGWLCLEDWFYSGAIGTDVSTLNTVGQGACLPPAVQGPLDELWPSEGVLVHRMVASQGPDVAIDNMRQHRESFITAKDLDDVASLGVGMVRVPLSWVAFADALKPIDAKSYGSFDPETEAAIVPDPFYFENVSYVTIPRNFLAAFLRNCSSRGFKVLLDLHAFPSGSSQGTYNGIYPNKPVFWWNNSRIGNTSVPLTDAGHWIVEKLISWVEGLDAAARAGVGGITVMNEPGHLLSSTLKHTKLLDWIAKGAEMFRASHLSARGVKLYVNLIQTAISDFDEVVVPWWEATFTEAERNMWAVMDLHNYLAWYDACEGHPANISGGGYKCEDPIAEVRKTLKDCLEPFVKNFAKKYKGLRSCSEFSLSTSSVAASACKNREVLDVFLNQQASLMKEHGIEPFFWSFKMPYGPNFEAGWSYHYHVGLAPPPPSQCLPPPSSTSTSKLQQIHL